MISGKSPQTVGNGGEKPRSLGLLTAEEDTYIKWASERSKGREIFSSLFALSTSDGLLCL